MTKVLVVMNLIFSAEKTREKKFCLHEAYFMSLISNKNIQK